MKQATVNLFFDTRKEDNKIKLKVIFERKQKLFSTGIKVSKGEWERLKKNAEKNLRMVKSRMTIFLTFGTSCGTGIILQKIARTRKGNQVRIKINLFPESWNIINRYKNSTAHESYVFPFLNSGTTAKQKKSTISQIVTMTIYPDVSP